MVILDNNNSTAHDVRRTDYRNGIQNHLHTINPVVHHPLDTFHDSVRRIGHAYRSPGSPKETFSSQSRAPKNSFTAWAVSSGHKDHINPNGYDLPLTKSFSALPSSDYSGTHEFERRLSAPPDLDHQHHASSSSGFSRLNSSSSSVSSSNSSPVTATFPTTFGTFHPRAIKRAATSQLPQPRPPPPSTSSRCVLISVFSTISTTPYPIIFGSYVPSSLYSPSSPVYSTSSPRLLSRYADLKTPLVSRLSASSANQFNSSQARLPTNKAEVLFCTKIANAMAHLAPASGKVWQKCSICSNHLVHCCGQTVLTMLLSRRRTEKCSSCYNPVKQCCIQTTRTRVISGSPPP